MELLEKFKNLEENVKILKEIKQTTTFKEVESNRRLEWEIRYGLLESIQLVIDISCKISSKYNLGNPKSYKDCIKLLEQFNYISSNLAKKVVSMVGLRNLLVHEYAKIDDFELYKFLDNVEDFIQFLDEVKSS